MNSRVLLPLVLGLCGSAATLSAENRLRLPVGTSPHTLQMRASAWRLAANTDSDKDKSADEDAEEESIFDLPTGEGLAIESGSLDRLVRRRLEADVLAPPAPLSEKLIFRFNLGMGLDGGLPSGDPRLSGHCSDQTENSCLNEAGDYQRLRIYSFGDGVIGTRGLGMSGLNSYFAAHYRFNQEFSQSAAAIPSIYDQDLQRTLVRSAYAELEDVFENPWLRPLYARAGRSFQYGLSVMHFDGLTVGYDTRSIKVSAYAGQRTPLYEPRLVDNITGGGTVSGWKFRVDLFELKRWPLVVFASQLRFEEKNHFRTGFALRWNRDMLLSSSLRALDGSMARSHFRLRARISDVTTVNVQLTNRSKNDWSYGLLQLRSPGNMAESDASAPRPYLDLGPVYPRSLLSVRYGTVLLRNLDLLLRASAALDRRHEGVAPNSFSSSYAELGGATEVRVRRSLRVGAALSARQYFLGNERTSLVPGRPDDLPATLGATGVNSFWEGGLNFNYSPGARQFSASSEVYGRRYAFRSEYLAENSTDFRSGGRFSLEGWVQDRVRLKAEYDLSFGALVMAPELRTLKTFRVLVEGSF